MQAMGVQVVPTLAFMADVYRRSTAGGIDSPRLHAYTAAAAERVPVAGYNPMTSQPAGATVEALLALDAETVAARVASDVAARLGVAGELELHLCVKTPGMWTDRIATEVEHRLIRGPVDEVPFWTGEPVDQGMVEAAVTGQVVRAVWAASRRADTPPATVDEVVGREGLALALAGETGAASSDVAEALAVMGDERDPATAAALLYGDPVAHHLGWTPLGLAPMAGYRHAVARATDLLGRRAPADIVSG
jgi:hypothetical protein